MWTGTTVQRFTDEKVGRRSRSETISLSDLGTEQGTCHPHEKSKDPPVSCPALSLASGGEGSKPCWSTSAKGRRVWKRKQTKKKNSFTLWAKEKNHETLHPHSWDTQGLRQNNQRLPRSQPPLQPSPSLARTEYKPATVPSPEKRRPERAVSPLRLRHIGTARSGR